LEFPVRLKDTRDYCPRRCKSALKAWAWDEGIIVLIEAGLPPKVFGGCAVNPETPPS